MVKKLTSKQIKKIAEDQDVVYLQSGTWYDFYTKQGNHRNLMFVATLYKDNTEIILCFLDEQGNNVNKVFKNT